MDRKTIEEYKKILLEKKEELQERIKKLQDPDLAQGGDPRLGNEPGDDAAEKETFNRSQDLLKEAQFLLDRIEGAFVQIEKNEFGTCQKCKNLIDPARMKAVPWALYCLDCEKKGEFYEETT